MDLETTWAENSLIQEVLTIGHAWREGRREGGREGREMVREGQKERNCSRPRTDVEAKEGGREGHAPTTRTLWRALTPSMVLRS